MTNETQNDPMELLKNMWSNMGFALPGMVTPTLDTDELSKHITDLKAVEGWLKSNLGMLQMTIQGLEMQRATLTAMQQMGAAAQAGQVESGGAPNPFLDPALWSMPWSMMGGSAVPPAGRPPGRKRPEEAAPTSAPSPAAPAKPAKAKTSANKKRQPKG